MAIAPVIHGRNPGEIAQTCSGKKRKWTVREGLTGLPCEILHNIALMLPLSAIKQLRRSNKFWYNLLSDPEFVNLHLMCALQKPPGCLFTPYYQITRRKKQNCYFVEQSEDHPSTSKIFEYSKDSLVGVRCLSSGGLMCVYSERSNFFRVFNPDIGEEVKVSDVPRVENWFQSPSWFFGYSPSTKEYKILEIGKLRTTNSSSSITVAAITTLGSNIWRHIQNVPPNIFRSYNMFSSSPTACQDYLFLKDVSNVVSFDLVLEKFHEIPDPPRNLANVIPGRVIIMWDTLVSMSHTVGYVRDDKLWVLEDKSKGIWVQRYDFSVWSSLDKNHLLTGILENGGLFGHDMGTLNVFSHDMGCKGFKVTEIKLEKERRGRASPKWVQYIATHVRSLVSPVRIMENGRKANRKRKWVLDRFKLGDDATEYDVFDRIYEVLSACDE